MLKRNLFLWLFTVAITFGASAQNYEWKEAQGGGYTYKYVTHDPTNARFYTKGVGDVINITMLIINTGNANNAK